MSRLSERLEALRERREKALVCYVVAGDPDLDRTVDIVCALDEAGVDAVELGIPFSDPLADGPSIQAAAHRALENGATVAKTLDVVKAIRARSGMPIVLMTYFNPTLRYGPERFATDAAAAGADATIQTDLTPEEAGDWIAASRRAGLDTVFLLAPTSTDARIDVVSRLSTGFVYCVSRTGVTGARQDVPSDLPELIRRVRARTSLPACVGFGVSTPDHVRKIGEVADGVVVGSSLVDLIDRNAASPSLVDEVRNFAGALKAATKPS
jgi:tryptophan synthase alpha chain